MKGILIAVLIVVIGVGIWWFMTQQGEPNEDASSKEISDKAESVVPEVNQTREFSLTGTPFKFSVNEIKVKKGDTVKITFKNESGKHDWKIDEFGAATKVLEAGQSETIQFVADKAGTFEYYCSVGTHRQMGMKGNLIVEE